ncbi:hypothetical protein, partial [Snodgrassella sp. CFCC 13594]|uniref:hypothetical protein n=1 Tax=Snodgrassella sp. CFCC 13594 TaxID=1775559 RepID=UPI001E31413A
MALMVPLAKEVYVKNTSTGVIDGLENGIDVLTYKVGNAHIDNAGTISGGTNGINLSPIKLTSTLGYTPTLTTLTNTQTGSITGGTNGLNNQGTIGTINNAGTMTGTSA